MNFEGIPAALTAIQAFLIEHAAKEADDFKTALLSAAASVSPVEQIVGIGKAVHEHRDTASAAAKDLGIAAIQFAAQNGWHWLAAAGPKMVEDLKAPPQAKAQPAKSAAVAATSTTPAIPAAADPQVAP